ncbi:MAG: hypothetical protein BM564_11440 [Bacteroidetes bacterium MedPE-SWsnd-G2]|nr:MAG: hypothetical protein BM564_11440 [Bacteroidetes bacterium MedPE-SWsnd-G2]
MIKKSKLDQYDFSNPNGFIPSSYLYQFLEQIQHSQGLYSIAGEFFNDFTLKGAGDYGAGLFVQPNLMQLVQGGIKFQHVLRTDQALDYKINGNTFEFIFQMIGKPSKQKTLQEDIAFAQTLDTFRHAGGEGWYPSEIHLTTKSVKRLEKLLGPGDYKIYCNQPVNKIVFPLDLAFKELMPNTLTKNTHIDFDTNGLLSNQITRLLQNASEGIQLNLNNIIEISNLSGRTLSRRLAEEGVTFNQLASNVMFSKATHLLTSTNFSVKEIAQHLGYSESPSFVRAFKKSSSLTPELFRAQC